MNFFLGVRIHWDMKWKGEPSLRKLSYLWEASIRNRYISFAVVQSLSRVQLFQTPWTTARQDSLSITSSWRWLKLISTESVMPSNHLILCHHSLLLLPPIFPSIRVFSNEYSGLISFRMDWLLPKGLSRVFSNTTVQKHQFFGAQLSL